MAPQGLIPSDGAAKAPKRNQTTMAQNALKRVILRHRTLNCHGIRV